MIKAIILSKDRPAQLHLCLEALNQNHDGVFSEVSVIYTSSSEAFEDGYELTQEAFENVTWVKQRKFKDDVMEELNDDRCRLISFFTDDDIMYRKLGINNNTLYGMFEALDELSCFSLRLGLNTVVQDPYNGMQTTPPTSGFIGSDEFAMWRWRDCPSYMNFGYPLSVDGHIFRASTLRDVHKDVEFNNPNQQEVAIQVKNPTLGNFMACFKQSAVVNTPLNRVQTTCMNRSGERFGCAAELMNERYCAGEKLDLSSIDFSNIVGCHQELEIKWTTK